MRPTKRSGAVFFDRDGVLNQDTGYVFKKEEFIWLSGAREAVKLVNDAGLKSVVVTNQSGIARGYYSEDDVHALHAWIQDDLARFGTQITAFYICPYHEDAVLPRYRVENHPDRKPNPGMILRAAEEWDIDLSRSLIIGDKASDIEAGARAGVTGVLYKGGDLVQILRSQLGQLSLTPSVS